MNKLNSKFKSQEWERYISLLKKKLKKKEKEKRFHTIESKYQKFQIALTIEIHNLE